MESNSTSNLYPRTVFRTENGIVIIELPDRKSLFNVALIHSLEPWSSAMYRSGPGDLETATSKGHVRDQYRNKMAFTYRQIHDCK